MAANGKARVKRVFQQYDDKAKAWVWMREYIWRDDKGKVVHKEVRTSPCQVPDLLKRGSNAG